MGDFFFFVVRSFHHCPVSLTRGHAHPPSDTHTTYTTTGLAALGRLPRLRRLSLRGCQGVTDAGLAYLPPTLEELDVSHCRGRHGWLWMAVEEWMEG